MNQTNIEWCDFTWNPVTGCPGPKVSPGCDNCYAERMATTRLRGRCGYDPTDPFMVTYHEKKLEEPLKMAKPKRIFVCSMGDLFHEDVDPGYIDEMFAVMAMCPQHEFIVLTKRVDRMVNYLTAKRDGCTMMEWLDCTDIWSDTTSELSMPYGEAPTGFAYDRLCRLEKGLEHASKVVKEQSCLPNVRLMATICNQEEANRLLPSLLWLGEFGWKCGVSIEPMLGSIDLTRLIYEVSLTQDTWLQNALTGEACCADANGEFDIENAADGLNKLGWVVCGGENGPSARPMHHEWVRSLRDQCEAAGVPFFFKGWGAWLPVDQFFKDPPSCYLPSYVYEDGKYYPMRINNGLHNTAVYRCKRPESGLFYGKPCHQFPWEYASMDPIPF